MPVKFVFDFGEVLAFEGLGDDSRWLVFLVATVLKSLDDFDQVVAVNFSHVPPESSETVFESLGIVLELSFLTLTQTVHINNAGQVLQLVVSSEVCGFPNRTFSRFTIT